MAKRTRKTHVRAGKPAAAKRRNSAAPALRRPRVAPTREEELQNHNEELNAATALKDLADSLRVSQGTVRQQSAQLRVSETEQALRQSEERYRSLFGSMGEAFALHEIVTDAQGRPCDYRFLDVNPAFERLTGFRRSEVVNRNVREVLPGIEPFWIETYGKVALTGESVTFEKYYPAPLDRWFEVFAYRPSPRQFATVFLDVTRRKQSEEALRQLNVTLGKQVIEQTQQIRRSYEAVQTERQRLYSVLETLPVYVILLTPDYHVPFANRFFRERFGESGGKRCFEYLFNREEPCEICETYTVMKTMKPHRWSWTGPDNRDYDIYDLPFVDSDGSPLILEMGVDITERKRAEQALRTSELRYRTLFESMDEGFCVVEKINDAGDEPVDFRFVELNLAFEEQTGLRNAVGKTLRELLPEHDPHWFEIYDAVARTGESTRFEVHVEALARFYGVFAFRIGEENNPRVGVLFKDITDQKRAEALQREAKETLEHRVAERTAELARSNQDLEQFARVASHDLQEPLRMVNGFLKLLREQYEPDLDDKAKEYVGYAVEGATRMSQLLTDLLAYSRLDRGGNKLRPTDASEALAGALANLRGSIQEAEASVTYDELPTINGDASQVTQLLQNVIGNAIKFRTPGRPCHVHVGVEKQNDEWVFSVRDNGIGIPEEAFARIFVIFQRLHTRDKYPGTGIGLAISRKIVERHGGRIWVDSTPGEGSAFRFTLPAVALQEDRGAARGQDAD